MANERTRVQFPPPPPKQEFAMHMNEYWFRPLAPFGKLYKIESPTHARYLCMLPRVLLCLACFFFFYLTWYYALALSALLIIAAYLHVKWFTKDMPQKTAPINWEYIKPESRVMLLLGLLLLLFLRYLYHL